ncbi:MAG: zinc ABC transporter substrate-binding protein [Verrucomicrobiae bacterium]|nr:zinc ABC transporter substrate-binding protein [Verrucomicrobiae bacterium]
MSPLRWRFGPFSHFGLLLLAGIHALTLSLEGAEARRLRILTSLSPLYSWAVNVAGTAADVENLLPADVGPHDYQFRPRDMHKIRSADIILLNGLGIESWFESAIQANAPSAAKKVVEVAAGVPADLLIREIPALHLEVEGEQAEAHVHKGPANPHLWLDPWFARHAVTNLLAALRQADAVNAATYEANAAGYIERLHALDREIEAGLAALPRRDVITFHDAFPYFCRRYQLKLVGVIEEVPGSSPSPRYLAALSAVIREQRVGVLFTEPQFDTKLARQLARDLQIAVANLDTLETGRLAASAYEDGMKYNLRALRSSLK